MALDKTMLKDAVKQAFKKAKEAPAPDPATPEAIDAVQEQILEALAQDLSDALDAYVRGGDVLGVQVEVKNNASVVIGTGTQNNIGHVE